MDEEQDIIGFAGGLGSAGGLVRFGARDYDPFVGRWLTKDPIRFDGGLNFYEYAIGDPVNYLDLNGLEVELLLWEQHSKHETGHLSVRVSNKHYSWVPGFGWEEADDLKREMGRLENENRTVWGYILKTTDEQESALGQILEKYKKTLSPTGSVYEKLFGNCADVVENAFEDVETIYVGLNLHPYGTTYSIIRYFGVKNINFYGAKREEPMFPIILPFSFGIESSVDSAFFLENSLRSVGVLNFPDLN